MTIVKDVMNKLKLQSGMPSVRAIQQTREYLDNQPDQLKAANDILIKFGLKPENNKRKAYVFAMTAVDQIINNGELTPEILTSKSVERINRITELCGTNSFNVEQLPVTTDGEVKHKGKKGSKRVIARQLYEENKQNGDEFVIDLIVKALDVTKQNAYTYVYLIKKDIKQGK